MMCTISVAYVNTFFMDIVSFQVKLLYRPLEVYKKFATPS